MELQLPYESHLRKYPRKTQALFHALRDSMISGRLQAGSRLPSTRALAEQYGLSRGTVNAVYDMLQAQGYVQAIPGSGTVVAYSGRERRASDGKRDVAAGLSRWGERIADVLPPRGEAAGLAAGPDPWVIDFSLGRVDLRHFPAKEWNRLLYGQVRAQYEDERKDAFGAEGHYPLREAIALHLRRTRGLSVSPEEIVVVSGSHQALALLAQLILDPGDAAVVENPGYPGTLQAVRAAGGKAVPCPVDGSGLVTDVLPPGARMVFTTPGRHFPTGAVMPMERRIELLRYAEQNRCWIIEDDYDSEFRYRGRPIEPLKALDASCRVAFVGTFSRTMMQDIRLGYAVLPPGLLDVFRKAKQLYEPHPSAILEQRALAGFLNSGGYERHLRRMRRIYMRRSERIGELLRSRLREAFRVYPNNAGLHVFAEWKGSEQAFDRFLGACARRNLIVPDMRRSYVDGKKPAAAFGFGHLQEEEIGEGVERLAGALAEVLPLHP